MIEYICRLLLAYIVFIFGSIDICIQIEDLCKFQEEMKKQDDEFLKRLEECEPICPKEARV